MTPSETVYDALSRDYDLGELIGHGQNVRAYPSALPEVTTYPAVVFAMVSREPHDSLCNSSGASTVTFALIAAAQSYTTAHTVCIAAKNAMLGISGSSRGPTSESYDSEMELHLVTTDFTFFHQES